MKTTPFVLILFLTVFAAWAQSVPSPRRYPRPATLATNTPAAPSISDASSAASSALGAASAATPSVPAAVPAATKPPEEMMPIGSINFQGVEVNQVLDVYAKLVGRTLLRASLPATPIILHTETPLTKSEAIQALQAVLALNGIALVNVGDKFVKVLPVDQANSAGAKIDHGDASQLPDMGSYVTHIVQLKYLKPSEMVPIITPFAKLANSILPIDANGILVLRDNAENVKRMLEMIDQIDVSVPAEYISEVIPIKYAMAEDIASALNGLGGSGGSTVSIGSSGSSGATSGASRSGISGLAGGTSSTSGNSSTTSQSRLSSQGASGTSATGGTTFQQRLQSIISKTSSSGSQQDQIQVFGQTKIIADQRSNSLLIFATQADMERIKTVIGKLDVLLAQVLIESVIMDVGINRSLSLGTSVAQNPKSFSGGSATNLSNYIGGGGMKNGSSFYDFLNSSLGTNTSSTFGNNLSSGLSYYGNIGPYWEVALTAAAADSSTSVIQRPRIQTSQAKAASFFVGQTVPYVTSSTYGSSYGNSSSYSQLSVGVELDVTPYINPDGLVVMDVNQEIDDLNGYTYIENVGNVPNTTKRTLNSEIAVRDRDTIILGGFIRNDKSNSKSGVPLLKDIPILGVLFSSLSKSHDRTELIVMIRPTVLRTPELAAAQAVKERERLPGVSAAAAEEAADQRKLVEAQHRAEMRNARRNKRYEGSFSDTNGIPLTQ